MTTTTTTIEDRYPTRQAAEPDLFDRRDPVVWGDPDDGPFGAEDLAGFEADGFAAVDSLVTPGEADAYRAELARLSADPGLRGDDRTIVEPGSEEVRSIFEVHRISEVFADLVGDERVAGRARQLLGSEVYVHQSRVNFKPGFNGKEFYWHSDFETWHAEDGMGAMRAVSFSIALTDNYEFNGGLMVMPASHRTFVACVGETPADHYKESLRRQEVGTPDETSLARLADQGGIRQFTGGAGSAVLFDCNAMHGSNGNITPYPRSNVFVVFNSVDNALVEPFAAPSPRPEFIASRDFAPLAA